MRNKIDTGNMRGLERDELGLPLALKSNLQQIARAKIMHSDYFTDCLAGETALRPIKSA